MKGLNCVRLFVTPWTVAHQAPLSMGFSKQEYWSGLPFPSPGDLPHPGIEPRSPTLHTDSLPSEAPGNPLSVVNELCIKSLQLCLNLCDLMDYSPRGFSVHGILQARTLEWVAISSSRGSSCLRIRSLTPPALAGRFFTTSVTSGVNRFPPSSSEKPRGKEIF